MPALLDGGISATFRRRDISKSYTLASAVEASFSTMAPMGDTPSSTLIEWGFKTRFAPSDNAINDGEDVQASELINNGANKHMMYGRLQKGRVVIGIDDMAETFGNEYMTDGKLEADNVKDAIILARENGEVSHLKTGDSTPFVSGTSQRRLRGLANWCRSANPVGGDLDVPAAALTPAAQIIGSIASVSDMTQAQFLGIMASMVTAARGNKNLHVFTSAAGRIAISGWTQFAPTQAGKVAVHSWQNNPKEKTITLTVDRIVCDVGEFFLHTHHMLPAGVHVLFVDMSAVKKRPGRKPTLTRLEYRGGVRQTMVEYVLGLEVNNPRLLGKITT